jgi:opacity protein-like surface antigen
MSNLVRSLGLTFVLAALCLGGRTSHAQVAPVPYWMPNGPIGFGGDLTGFDGSDIRDGGVSRYNFPNGWFLGSTRSSMSMNGFSRLGAFGNFGSLASEGAQFGYNFKNAPVSIYAGFDTLKYNTGAGGPFAPFDGASGTLPGYSAQAGIEFRPTSNLSLSLGVGFTQQPSLLPGAAPFAVGR